MTRSASVAALLVALFLFGGAPASGQTAPSLGPASPNVQRTRSNPAPSLRLSPWSAPAVLRHLAAPDRSRIRSRGPAVSPLPQERNSGGIPYMVAGGALFVAGAVVGGDGGTILMVAGAGIGAYGLFVYFGGDTD